MFSKTKIFASVLLAAALQPASAIELKVDSYTGNSVTFTLTGAMPSTNPGTLADGPNEIDLLYTGNLWAGGKKATSNTLTAGPIAGSGGLQGGSTGGFTNTTTNYSWLYFNNDLTGLDGSGKSVTLTFVNAAGLLNTLGTGTIDLYWGNLANGVDASGKNNVLLSSVNIVDGKVQSDSAVPEPASLALFGLGALGLAAVRRRSRG